jgi:hypothetical protein
MPSLDIVIQALKDKGVSQKEIDDLPRAASQEGADNDEDRKFLALVRFLVKRHKEKATGPRAAVASAAAADDPVVGCFFTENNRKCTINTDFNTWQTIQLHVDHNATNGAPVPAAQEGWRPL